jgi:hypothetical protein
MKRHALVHFDIQILVQYACLCVGDISEWELLLINPALLFQIMIMHLKVSPILHWHWSGWCSNANSRIPITIPIFKLMLPYQHILIGDDSIWPLAFLSVDHVYFHWVPYRSVIIPGFDDSDLHLLWAPKAWVMQGRVGTLLRDNLALNSAIVLSIVSSAQLGCLCWIIVPYCGIWALLAIFACPIKIITWLPLLALDSSAR